LSGSERAGVLGNIFVSLELLIESKGYEWEINSIPAPWRCCILERDIKIHIKTFEPREISPQDLLSGAKSSKILFMNDMFSVGLCRAEGAKRAQG